MTFDIMSLTFLEIRDGVHDIRSIHNEIWDICNTLTVDIVRQEETV